MTDQTTAEVTDLLQHLIRNACVNDGTRESGQEERSVDVLEAFLGGGGFDVERYEPAPGRRSLVARIEGSDPSAPSLCLMGHTDVVPVSANRWRRDPFGGELVDGEVWGRGAVDMLNLTSSMAVAFRDLARSGFRPRGTLVFLAVADEEASGAYGADWLTAHASDAVGTNYVLTEEGGVRIPTAPSGSSPSPESTGVVLPITVAEKGSYWVRLRVSGTAGHASQPHRTDNALLTAAEVVGRIGRFAPEAVVDEGWRRWAEILGDPELLDPATLERAIDRLPAGTSRHAHACTHTTFAPTIAHGGVKTNVIPDLVEIEVDIRSLPGQSGADVAALLDQAIGEDLRPRVEVEVTDDEGATASPASGPLWDTLRRVSGRLVPGSGVVPLLSVGATDARFFRRAGATCYGFGLFSERMTMDAYQSMFHGDDERIDVESLGLSTELWGAVARDFLG